MRAVAETNRKARRGGDCSDLTFFVSAVAGRSYASIAARRYRANYRYTLGRGTSAEQSKIGEPISAVSKRVCFGSTRVRHAGFGWHGPNIATGSSCSAVAMACFLSR